ncbi:MAG: penicillin-binding protein 1C [Oligoflexia bacterium]|nr:penicillin-binding protein 1C [Oligoflexia bacterium]
MLAIGLLLGLAGLVAAWVVPLPARLSVPGSSVIRWRDGSVATLGLSPDQRWRLDVRPDQVDPAYVEALIRLEDRRFWWHPGVDPLAIARAAVLDLLAGRVVSGGSTITMQVARLCQPRPRTLRSKIIEAARAVQLELRLDKEQILSAYLALAPYGGNIEGVEAASLAWFGHSADHLAPAEIATLLAIPQSPAARAPSPDNLDRLRAARGEVARRLLRAGLLEPHLAQADEAPGAQGSAQGSAQGLVSAEQVLARIEATPLPQARLPLPRAAPHVAAWLLAGQSAGGTSIMTTLDRGTQFVVERTVQSAIPQLLRHGIRDLSVVVVENDSGDLAALVGGANFWADSPGAQIPSFTVPRSPGSALKPVLYTRAIDRGIALPETLVVDAPVHYGGYSPENYDGSYDGLVSLEDALSRSLNVPFVRLLQRVGVEPFLGDLRALGVRSLDPKPGHYGLSAIVGGVEITPLEMAGIYSALARGGAFLPLRWRLDAPHSAPQRVFSQAAIWLTARALGRRDRPDFPARQYLSAAPRFVRWKTGTSFGNRDAWAVGWGARYTVVVWLGNLDRQPSAWLVGATSAGPLLFDLVDALHDGQPSDPGAKDRAPSGLTTVSVCALSGKLAGEHCPQRRTALAVAAHVPPKVCDLHHQVELDRATGLRVGPGCRDGRDTTREVRVLWPSAVRRWLVDRDLAVATAPPLAPACIQAARGAGLTILSPVAGQEAVLIPGLSAESQEFPLRAQAAPGELTWFVDGERVGVASADAPVWWEPRPGSHRVLVMDSSGRSASTKLDVRRGGASLGLFR